MPGSYDTKYSEISLSTMGDAKSLAAMSTSPVGNAASPTAATVTTVVALPTSNPAVSEAKKVTVPHRDRLQTLLFARDNIGTGLNKYLNNADRKITCSLNRGYNQNYKSNPSFLLADLQTFASNPNIQGKFAGYEDSGYLFWSQSKAIYFPDEKTLAVTFEIKDPAQRLQQLITQLENPLCCCLKYITSKLKSSAQADINIILTQSAFATLDILFNLPYLQINFKSKTIGFQSRTITLMRQIKTPLTSLFKNVLENFNGQELTVILKRMIALGGNINRPVLYSFQEQEEHKQRYDYQEAYPDNPEPLLLHIMRSLHKHGYPRDKFESADRAAQIQILLALGANPNAANARGMTTLMFAAWACPHGQTLIASLLAAGANVHLKNSFGKNAYFYAEHNNELLKNAGAREEKLVVERQCLVM